MFADHSIMHIGTHVARRTAMLEGRAPQPPSSSPSPSSSSSPPPRRPRDNAVRKMRTAPLTGEHVEDFFFPASRGPSLALQKNSSSLSSQSTKSTRTVSSLRSEPMHFAVQDFDKDEEVVIRKSMESFNNGSPQSVVIPDIQLEPYHFTTAYEVRPALAHSPDVSLGSISTPSRNSSVCEQKTTTNISDASLSATDVKLFVQALKRYAGEDFSDLIQSIKKKQEPDFQCLSQQQLQDNKQRRRRTKRTQHDVNDRIYIAEEEGHDLRIEVATTCPTTEGTTDKNISNDNGLEDWKDEPSSRDPDLKNEPLFEILKLNCKRRNKSTITSEVDSTCDSRSWGSEDTPLENTYILESMRSRLSSMLDTMERPQRPDADTCPGDTAIDDMPRKISFSGTDRVRLYDLTDDEIVHKRVNDEDEIPREARSRRKIPGLFCASGPQVNNASELLSKLHAEVIETAKGIHKKCEEKGWLRDVDGLLKYFGKGSSKSESLGGRFCGVHSDPEPADHVSMDVSVSIIHASESREGLQISLRHSFPSKASDGSKTLKPSKRFASEGMDHTECAEVVSYNPLKDYGKSSYTINEASVSFDSHAPSDEGNTADEIMSPTNQKIQRRNHIHLLEIEEADSQKEKISRFEC